MTTPRRHLRIGLAPLALLAGLALPTSAAQAATPEQPVAAVQSRVATVTETVERTAAPVVKQVRQATDRPVAQVKETVATAGATGQREAGPAPQDRPGPPPSASPAPVAPRSAPSSVGRSRTERPAVRAEQRSAPTRRARSAPQEPAAHAERAARPAGPLAVEVPRDAPVPSESASPSDETSPTGTGEGAAVTSSAAAAAAFAFFLAALCFALARRHPRGRRLSLAPAQCSSALLFAAVERPG